MTYNHNGQGMYGSSSYGSMKAYDRLPKALRSILANAPYNFTPNQIERERKKRKWTIQETAERMQEALEHQIQENILHSYGPDHPQYKGDENATDI